MCSYHLEYLSKRLTTLMELSSGEESLRVGGNPEKDFDGWLKERR